MPRRVWRIAPVTPSSRFVKEPAQVHLTTATTMYREMGMRFWLEQADMAIAGPG